MTKQNTTPTVLAKVYGSSGKTYEIRLSNRDHKVYCTCPSWKFSKGAPKTCTHLEEFSA